MEMKLHWEKIYQTKAATELSWYQSHADKSLELIKRTGVDASASLIDVGGGISPLVGDLLARNYQDVTVLDISGTALRTAQKLLRHLASRVKWIEADITVVELEPLSYDVWHDRAVFHFLTDTESRTNYIDQMRRSVKSGGHVIIVAFSHNGPKQCSELNVVRYSQESLQNELGNEFTLKETMKEIHLTPWSSEQCFIYCRFQKL